MLTILYIRLSQGSDYKALKRIVILLILSNLANVYYKSDSFGLEHIVFDYLKGFSYTLKNGAFVLAFALLAWRYREVSIEIPLILKDERITATYKKWNERRLKLLIVAIIIISIVLGAVDGIANQEADEAGTIPSSTVLLILTIAIWVSNVITVINGLVMIAAINRIRNFFIKNDATAELNTWYLGLTKASFYIYLVS
jgi:hypothetical protein